MSSSKAETSDNSVGVIVAGEAARNVIQHDNPSDYGPAYSYGASAQSRFPDREFDDAEQTLAVEWYQQRGTSTLSWERAKDAARDGWMRAGADPSKAV